MLAIIYLIIMVWLGNLLCRRFYDFISLPHKLAGAFLVGLLVSTWTTYLLALAFYRTQNPLLWGNLLFFVAASLFIWWSYRQTPLEFPKISLFENHNTERGDWIFTAVIFLCSCWLMFGMFSLSEGNLEIDSIIWNDFGPNLSLVQSFAVGRNFPTEYPHFIGEPIRYHFMFWFQTGNLTFLGLDIDWSLNILSALSMTAMLSLLVVVGQAAFNSKAVGRIAAALFFFHGSLSYIPFLLKADSLTEAFYSVVNSNEWLKSIYTYTGEQWGVWSLGTFLAQRHLPTSIGIFLLIFIFLIRHVRETFVAADAKENVSADNAGEALKIDKLDNSRQIVSKSSGFSTLSFQNLKLKILDQTFQTYIFSGILLGLLPLWNSAVYVSAFAVIGGLLFFFRNRIYTFILLFTSAFIAVPQIFFLRAGASKNISELFQWGYVVDPPTLANVAKYFSFTFGAKTLLALVAIILLSAFQRRLFAALCVLLILAFSTKLSTDIMNNHKFLHIWVIFVNLFVAYALWRVYKWSIAGKVAAALLVIFISFGGVIELFRIRNDYIIEVPYSGGRLYEWLYAETEPKDIFLSDKFNHHQILLAGRKIFYGWHYFGWSLSYPAPERDVIYKRLFEEQNPITLVRLLRRADIKYVGIDDPLRQIHFRDTLNEAVCEKYFEKVFVDQEKSFGGLIIYKVPERNLTENDLK